MLQFMVTGKKLFYFNNRQNNNNTDYITLRELQIWIKDDANGIQNIAPLFTNIDTNDPDGLSNGRVPSQLINNIIDDESSGLWHSTKIGDKDGDEIYATFGARI